MNSVKWTAVIITGALSLTAGCTSQPVYNVSDAAVIASKQSVTLDEVSKAIVRAGAGLEWQMNETKPVISSGRSIYATTQRLWM
jgi:hypothetical protein